MRVLSVAYPFAPVGERAVGGAEQVVRALDRALVEAGHGSTVIAAAGSDVRGTLLAVDVVLGGEITDAMRRTTWPRVEARIRGACANEAIDLVHFHGVDFQQYLPDDGPPALATLHLPLHRYRDVLATSRRSPLWFNCVSASQQGTAGAHPRLLPFIANGVDTDALRPVERPSADYVVALGRICPEKGFELALDAARAAGVALKLAGEVYPYPDHVRYWHEQIVPRLEGPHERLPPVGGAAKRALLAHARCLLVASQIDETSSLVAMEALACGTPVVAFRAGALPEIVAPGRTGWLVDDVAGMAGAIARCAEIDRTACRAEALARYGADRMARDYLALYRRILAAHA